MIISTKRFNLYLFLTLIVFLSIGALWEKIPVNNGLGWDGYNYSQILKTLVTTHVFDADSYLIQRVFPFLLTFGLSKLLNFPINDSNIIQCFIIINYVSLIAAFFIWVKISDFYQFDLKIRALSFMAIFLNYANLKMAFYYPVLTDTLALLFGLLLFYFHVKDKKIALISTTMLGAFTFPTLLFVGLLFLYWPYKTDLIKSEKKNIFYHAIPVIIVGAYLTIVNLVLPVNAKIQGRIEFLNINPINDQLFPLSILCCIVYLYLISQPLKNLNILSILKKVNLINLGIAAALFVIFKAIIREVANDRPGFTWEGFGINLILQSLTNPLSFILSHLLYFGPLGILIIVGFQRFIKNVEAEGVGIFAFVYLYLFLLIGNESRQFVNAYPLFFILFFINFDSRIVNWKLIGFLGIFSLAYSRFWFKINVQKFEGKYLDFPWQNYFMSQGPWMSNTMYYIFMAIILMTTLVTFYLFRSQFVLLFSGKQKSIASKITSE